MKTLYAAAALLMVSTSAHAGNAISLEIGGHRIRIEAPRNCGALSCLRISGLEGIDLNGLKPGGEVKDDAPAPAAAPAAPPAPAAVNLPPPPAAVAARTPEPAPAPAVSAPASAAHDEIAAAAPAPAPAPVAPPPAPAAVAAPASPLGVWATEANKGNVRIEPCGASLCGYAEKTGEKILINMQPSDNKWVGRIHDPSSGSNYDSTIALKGPNALRVQGCAFGGMFCGGQTWKRVS
jgi:uncharacterized protein (DUF2147 family)